MKILQIGQVKWDVNQAGVEWLYVPFEYVHEVLETRRVGRLTVPDVDFVVLSDDVLDNYLYAERLQDWGVQQIIYVARQVLPSIGAALRERQAFAMPGMPVADILKRLPDLTKWTPTVQLLGAQARVPFGQMVTLSGPDLQVNGDFSDGQTVAVFDVPFEIGADLEVWVDATLSDGMQAQLHVDVLDEALQQTQVIDQAHWRQLTLIAGAANGRRQLRVRLQGQGKAVLHGIYLRESRHGFGHGPVFGMWQPVVRGEVLLANEPGDRRAVTLVIVGDLSAVQMQDLRHGGWPFVQIGGQYLRDIETVRALVADYLESYKGELIGVALGNDYATAVQILPKNTPIYTVTPMVEVGSASEFDGALMPTWRALATGRLDVADTEQLNAQVAQGTDGRQVAIRASWQAILAELGE